MRAEEQEQIKMLDLVSKYNITVLDNSEEAETLAALYQEKGVIPLGSTVDAQHIAVATINDLDMIISLNFKHIVRKKTVTMTGRINADFGYRPVEIHSPMEVVDRENT